MGIRGDSLEVGISPNSIGDRIMNKKNNTKPPSDCQGKKTKQAEYFRKWYKQNRKKILEQKKEWRVIYNHPNHKLPKPVTVIKQCLGCGKNFKSEGNHNRVCKKCKSLWA